MSRNRFKLLAASLVLTGCSVNPAHVDTVKYDASQVENIKAIFIVVDSKGDGRMKIARAIKSELAKFGTKSSYGDLTGKPGDVNFYIRYDVQWGVDIFPYLLAIRIQIYNRDNRVIAKGEFRDKHTLHHFSDSAEAVKIIIHEIFKNKQVM